MSPCSSSDLLFFLHSLLLLCADLSSSLLQASIKNVTKDIAERPSKILRVMAEDYEEIEELGAGDIAALVVLARTSWFPLRVC